MLTVPRLEVLADPEAVAAEGATLVAEALRAAIAARGRATFAVSGGRTPARMLALLAEHALPWERIDIFQVDERLAPDGHRDRNATLLAAALAAPLAAHPERLHLMPVTASDPAAAAPEYAAALSAAAGSPPVLDIVHLGLGTDGHTASLFPGEPLDESRDVAVTGVHVGRRRMTLTLPALDRARAILWLVTGSEKASALEALVRGDPVLVAGRVRRAAAVILADAAAATRVLDARGLA